MKKIWGILLLTIVVITFWNCSAFRHIPEGKTLLVGNIVYSDSLKQDYDMSELSGHVIQQPYRQLLHFAPRLWLYYNTEDMKTNFGKWIHRVIAKEPVYFDKTLAENSVKSMKRYLFNSGYFNADIEITPFHVTDNKYTYVYYRVIQPQPYRINSKKFSIADTVIAQYVNEIAEDLPVKEGKVYNAFTIDKERTQLTEYIRDKGYYFFEKEYIYYEVDTALNCHKVNITVRIDNAVNEKTGISEPHKKYFINNVYIHPNYNVLNYRTIKNDTVKHEFVWDNDRYEHYFVFNGDPGISLKTFNRLVLIHRGDAFSTTNSNYTYKLLNNLKIYGLNKISYQPVECDTANLLNCNITLQRVKKNYYSLQLEGTNSGGDLGILGALSYQNKNIFKGGEILNIRLKGELQGQHIVKDNNNRIFHSYQVGLETSVVFPRLVSPWGFRAFSSEYQPKTTLSLSLNQLVRTYYKRNLVNARISYDWKVANKVQHIVTPIEYNLVYVDPSEEFQKFLDKEVNQRLKDQYTSHLLLGLGYTLIFSNQNIKHLTDFFYFKADIQTSGNLLSLFNNFFDKKEGYYSLFDIRYAQYVRTMFDFRYYHLFGNAELVSRAMFGLGLPYGNTRDMPFEKSFAAGGANGMRGWLYRTLGPGRFLNAEKLNIERIGDIQLEFNLEYRFPIYSFVKGAFFVDAGNVWLLNENATFKGGEFDFKEFYRQLGVDGGFGLRFDFSFFLIRLDLAMPLCDPQYPDGERWRFSKLQFKDFVANIGIGYPF